MCYKYFCKQHLIKELALLAANSFTQWRNAKNVFYLYRPEHFSSTDEGKKIDLTGNKSTNRPHLLAGPDLDTGNAVVGRCWNRRDLQDVPGWQKGVCVITILSKKVVNLHPTFWDRVRASDSHHESKEFLVLSKGWPSKHGRCKHKPVLGLGREGGVELVLLRRSSSV